MPKQFALLMPYSQDLYDYIKSMSIWVTFKWFHLIWIRRQLVGILLNDWLETLDINLSVLIFVIIMLSSKQPLCS